jgi:hypothetical protein
MADSSPSAAPTVTQSPSTFTVDLPGVGSLTFTVDPATGALSNLVATADSGFTAGTPQLTDEGVQVSFTSASGAPTVLQAQVEREDGTVRVKPEVENDNDHDAAVTPANATGKDDHGAATDDDSQDTVEQAAPAKADEANDNQANENQANENQAHDGHDGRPAPTPAMTGGTGSQTTTVSSSDGDGSGGRDGGSATRDGSGDGHDGGGRDGGGSGDGGGGS